MSLKDRFSADVIDCFLNTAEFAEVITYTPQGQAAKDINAIVVRGRLEPGSEDQGRGLQNQAEIYIANDTVITLDDVEGTIREARIIEVLHKDAGAWHLLVGW
ncbi:MAG: hypothetical protein HZC18_02130 [Candidatus Omnitrophica bacterium]|nr:hypothetical protein [Candidatus Omnitrophota bacterium]